MAELSSAEIDTSSVYLVLIWSQHHKATCKEKPKSGLSGACPWLKRSLPCWLRELKSGSNGHPVDPRIQWMGVIQTTLGLTYKHWSQRSRMWSLWSLQTKRMSPKIITLLVLLAWFLLLVLTTWSDKSPLFIWLIKYFFQTDSFMLALKSPLSISLVKHFRVFYAANQFVG